MGFTRGNAVGISEQADKQMPVNDEGKAVFVNQVSADRYINAS